eukprot:scaffold2830_cov131-Cylindrotheca_fusiformis.AAC.16
MIEAAERQARLLSELKKQQQTSEEDDALIEPTLAGMSALAGACGTYAVKEPLGLAVLPFDPNLRHDGRKDGEEKKTEEAREPFTIEDGQMVQVVAEDDGVYQLARGVGYIVASVNQLVKGKTIANPWRSAHISILTYPLNHPPTCFVKSPVGGPLEKSCRLEGMLDSVLQKRMQLQKQVDELTLLANGLREQIKIEDDKPEEHPVISARKERPQINDENDDEVEKQHPATPPKQPTVLQSPPSTDSTEVEVGIHQTPVLMAQRHIYENSPARSCPMPMRDHNSVTEDHLQQPFMDEQSAGLPRYRISNDDNELGITGSLFGCGSALFGERLLELDGNSRNLLEGMNSMVLSFDDEEATLGGRSHNTARTTDDSTYRSMPTRTGSFDGGAGVNFRTGMSGHRGLTQVKKKASPSSHSRREIRMMSDHRGVGHVRGSQKPENHVHPRTYMP